MKTITKVIFLCSLFFVLNVNAQAPNKFSFQAIVRNASNQLVVNQTVGVKISLISVVMSSENAEFVETHTVTTNVNGLFSLKVGEGTLVSGDFSTTMNSNAQSKKIKCEIDPTGGTNYTIISNEQLTSVPYALKSNSSVFANNADFATTATSATSANSVVGIAGNEGFVPVFGANNGLGNSGIFNDSESGNVGIQNQNPIVGLDVAGNGTILARKRIVLGPVGGNPATEPVWAMDNYNKEFRLFRQSDVFTDGNTFFAVDSTGNVKMTNKLNVAGNITAQKITTSAGSNLGSNCSLGINSSVGTNFYVTGSQIEKLTILHLTGNNIINYDLTDTDRNIIVMHDDSEYGRYRINLPLYQPTGRVLDITLYLNSEGEPTKSRKYVEITNLLPNWIYTHFQNFTDDAVADGVSLGYSYNSLGDFTNTVVRTSLTHMSLIYSVELKSWLVKSSNYASSTH